MVYFTATFPYVVLLILLMSMMAGRIFLGFGSWDFVMDYLTASR